MSCSNTCNFLPITAMFIFTMQGTWSPKVGLWWLWWSIPRALLLPTSHLSLVTGWWPRALTVSWGKLTRQRCVTEKGETTVSVNHSLCLLLSPCLVADIMVLILYLGSWRPVPCPWWLFPGDRQGGSVAALGVSVQATCQPWVAWLVYLAKKVIF